MNSKEGFMSGACADAEVHLAPGAADAEVLRPPGAGAPCILFLWLLWKYTVYRAADRLSNNLDLPNPSQLQKIMCIFKHVQNVFLCSAAGILEKILKFIS